MTLPEQPDSVISSPDTADVPDKLPGFRAGDQRFLTGLLTLFLLGISIEWILLVTAKPLPPTLQRGDSFRRWFNVDVNTGTWIDWMQLEGIGPGLAHRIEADRRLNGPFQTIDDVGRVPGIGPVTLDRIRPWLTISHAKEKQGTER
jgi:competence protein ComEA